jgi:hypothetical protein
MLWEVVTVCVLHLSCNVVNGLLCCNVVILLQRMFLWCGIMCVLRCACMCVLSGSYCIKTFLQMLMLLILCSISSSLTSLFFFLIS